MLALLLALSLFACGCSVALADEKAASFQSPLDYWGIDRSELHEDKTLDGYFLQSVRFPAQNELYIREYIDDLVDAGFSFQIKSESEMDLENQAFYRLGYYLSYTGDEAMGSYESWDGHTGQLMLSQINDHAENYTLVSWYWVDELEPIDVGLRSDSGLPGFDPGFDPGFSSSGSGGSSDDSSSGSSSSGGGTTGWFESRGGNPVPCPFCSGGEVSCSACGGDGGKWVYSSTPNYSGSTSGSKQTRTWENCYKCRGSGKQDCSHCGGDGKM